MGLSPVGNEKNEVEKSPESGFKERSGFMCVLKRDLTPATLQLLPHPGQCMEAVREKHGSVPAWQLTLAVQSPAGGRASSSQNLPLKSSCPVASALTPMSRDSHSCYDSVCG